MYSSCHDWTPSINMCDGFKAAFLQYVYDRVSPVALGDKLGISSHWSQCSPVPTVRMFYFSWLAVTPE